MRESELAFKKERRKYDRTNRNDHTPYENRGLFAGIRTVDTMHRFHTMRDIDDCEDAIKTFLKRNPDTCFVAEDDDGRIIGAILAGNDGRRSRIYHTAVDPDARGRGIGSMLVGRVVETLRAIGLPKVAVGVPADNDAGNDFWERQGFAVRDDLVYRELPL